MRDRLLKWPFTDQKTGVTCAIITTRMVRSTFLEVTIASERNVFDILLHFFGSKTKRIQIIPKHWMTLSK
jgi:hypothetical protein